MKTAIKADSARTTPNIRIEGNSLIKSSTKSIIVCNWGHERVNKIVDDLWNFKIIVVFVVFLCKKITILIELTE